MLRRNNLRHENSDFPRGHLNCLSQKRQWIAPLLDKIADCVMAVIVMSRRCARANQTGIFVSDTHVRTP